MTPAPLVRAKPKQPRPEPGVSDGSCSKCGGPREGHGFALVNDMVCRKCWKLERGQWKR